MSTQLSRSSTASFLIALLSITLIAQAAPAGSAAQPAVKAGDYTITGPYEQGNLSVFLIHGADRLKETHYLTLQDAMEKKIVIVHETGNVNELSIENVSPDQVVYIQSGDIVKGGRQDRTIALDFIAPPKSGKMPIDAFCVESGRWHGRGGESPAMFASSANQLAGKDLKLAAKQSGNQSEVWQRVAKRQSQLSENAGVNVADAQSASSLELSLENKEVGKKTDAYVKKLAPIAAGKDDVVGYAFAINGKINSVDLYANHELFMKLWPKLIKSSAVEALADLETDKPAMVATADGVKACILDAGKGKKSEKDVTPRVQVVTRETADNIVFQTHDRAAAADAAVHENYVNKK